MTPSLSALVIAKDEERDLPGCLDSLKGLADEIVVLVDAATRDATERIARAAGAKVARRAFDDYARQRQAALALCTKDWVLWIDADERVSPGLRECIPRLMSEKPDVDAWAFFFSVRFLGRELRFGGLGCERHVRLFRRAQARFVGGVLHEGVDAGPRVALFRGHKILHEPYRDIQDYLSKLDRYTDLAAQKRLAAGRHWRPWDALRLPAEFVWRWIFKLGILDGYPGLVWAWLSAYHSHLKYAKLRQLERQG